MSRHVLLVSSSCSRCLVVHLYGIEGAAFLRRVHARSRRASPSIWSLPMALPSAGSSSLLSLAGIVPVFGCRDGAWLLAAGLTLIGLCHLPVALTWRVIVLLVAAGACFAAVARRPGRQRRGRRPCGRSSARCSCSGSCST